MSVAASADGRSTPEDAAPADLADAVICTLRLARGEAPIAGAERRDWALVRAVATQERCDVLCWARAGQVIRAMAPTAVQAEWRRGVLVDQELRRHQLAALLDVTGALETARCDPVVLKGAPLSQRLYGDPLLRPTSDLDLYVPIANRDRAAATLAGLGWQHRQGAPPWEEVFARGEGPWTIHCELHYALQDDALAHVPLPPPAVTRMRVAGVALPVHDGPALPAYLAAHMVKHQLPPLLWRLDFAALWSSLGRMERRAALAMARGLRLHRYLAWAIRQAELVDKASQGDRAAVRALGFAGETRREFHAMARTAALAATPLDAARVLGAWALPRPLRGDRRALLAQLGDRIALPVRRVAVKALRYERPVPTREADRDRTLPRALALPPDEVVHLVRDVVGRGGSLWIRARGRSMAPAVPTGALVRVAPLGGRRPRPGEVVLARLSTGVPAVHRVVACAGDAVWLRGDAQVADDPPVPLEDVLGLVDRVAIDGRSAPLPARRAAPLWRSIAEAGHRLCGRLTRVARG